MGHKIRVFARYKTVTAVDNKVQVSRHGTRVGPLIPALIKPNCEENLDQEARSFRNGEYFCHITGKREFTVKIEVPSSTAWPPMVIVSATERFLESSIRSVIPCLVILDAFHVWRWSPCI